MKYNITHVYTHIRPGGGPAGYLYGLKNKLLEKRIKDIAVAVNDNSNERYSENKSSKINYLFSSLLPNNLLRIILLKREISRWNTPPTEIMGDHLSQSKIIIFHSSRLAYQHLRFKTLNKSAKIFLMPHGPTDLSAEIIEDWKTKLPKGKNLTFESELSTLRNFEIRAFQEVDGIITPSRECLQNYFENHIEGNRIIKSKNIIEIPTGIKKPTIQNNVLLNLSATVPCKNPILIGFFGRYHTHKGFDIFIKIAEMAEKLGHTNLYFISAGAGPITPPNFLKNYLNLGWLKTELFSAISQCNLIISPNRFTYFDIFILEAMGLGKPIITSYTGGNIYLSKLTNGVITTEDNSPESYLTTILNNADLAKQASLGIQNEKIFDEYFSLDRMIETYKAFSDSI